LTRRKILHFKFFKESVDKVKKVANIPCGKFILS